MIAALVAASPQPALQAELETTLEQMVAQGWANLATAIRQIWAGERDTEVLCQDLNEEERLTVQIFLQGIEDPASFSGQSAD